MVEVEVEVRVPCRGILSYGGGPVVGGYDEVPSTSCRGHSTTPPPFASTYFHRSG